MMRLGTMSIFHIQYCEPVRVHLISKKSPEHTMGVWAPSSISYNSFVKAICGADFTVPIPKPSIDHSDIKIIIFWKIVALFLPDGGMEGGLQLSEYLY